ncbi:helix-turn-helix transcriptional regulator [Halostella sp. JP-L12]|uniref:PadR family transcriptional regulator n=1 Tax=Halostella TaxID=1843185 RepID=UPI000EF7C8C9|nr:MULTISPECIES: PadR family transcriptional regulator [Halostella]NHN49325.1 helix-turn-helix transcriptional regulator [Halostella sp. JP-L12]
MATNNETATETATDSTITNGDPITKYLTGFQKDLLYVVADLGSPHGLAIKAEMEDDYEQEIHHGRLYPNLDTLVDKGLIDKGDRDRRTNYYELTARGRREIRANEQWGTDRVAHLLED